MSFFSRRLSIPKEGTDGDGDYTSIMNERKVMLVEENQVTSPTSTRPSSTDEEKPSLILPCMQLDGNTSSQRTEPAYILAPSVGDRHDEKTKALLGILDSTSTHEAFQVLSKVPCPVGGEPNDESQSHDLKQESNLSESDVADIDNLIGILNGPRSLFLASFESIASLGSLIDFESRSQAQLDSASGEFSGAIMSHTFETFEAIGQMQLEQSLGSRPGQHEGGDSLVGDEPSAVTPTSLGLLFVLPSMFGLLCTVWGAVSWLIYRFPVSEIVVTRGVAHHDTVLNQMESDVFDGAIAVSEACMGDHDVFTDKVPFIDDPVHAVEIIPFAPLAELTDLPAVSNPNVLSTSLQIIHNDKGTSLYDTKATNLSMVVLMAVAVAYILKPRRFANSQRRLEQLSVPQLHVEFQKRGLLPPRGGIRQDFVRHLCEHDGIPHTFVHRKVDKFDSLTKIELQRDLKALGANISGKKRDLQYRLVVAREAFYNRLPEDELLRIVRYTDSIDKDVQVHELARQLAEAGPRTPLRALK